MPWNLPRPKESDRGGKRVSLKRYQSQEERTQGGNNLEDRACYVKYHGQASEEKD